MTGAQICQLIVFALGLSAKPEEVWNANPRGDLFHVIELFNLAEAELASLGIGPRITDA